MKLPILLLCAFLVGPVVAKGHGGAKGYSSSGSSHAIKGHVTNRGTYVAPTRATNPNRTQRDNYSTRGNLNPASGKAGTKIPKR